MNKAVFGTNTKDTYNICCFGRLNKRFVQTVAATVAVAALATASYGGLEVKAHAMKFLNESVRKVDKTMIITLLAFYVTCYYYFKGLGQKHSVEVIKSVAELFIKVVGYLALITVCLKIFNIHTSDRLLDLLDLLWLSVFTLPFCFVLAVLAYCHANLN